MLGPMSFANPLPPGIRQVVPDYVSDGVTLAWNFPFRLWASADLFVGVAPASAAANVFTEGFTQLYENVDYYLSITGTSGAVVTLRAPQLKGTLIRLLGLRTPSRTTSVVNDGVLQSGPFESELDVLEATLQEVRRDVGGAYTALTAGLAAAAATQAQLAASVYAIQTITNAQIQLWLTGANGPLPTVMPTTPGAFWNNGGSVCVTPGGSNPLPTIEPGQPGIFWNNVGNVCVS